MENLEILNYLMKKGFALHLSGTRYLAYMISIYQPGDLITKELYPVCGQHYGKPWQSVERCCRTAISDAWKGKGRVPCVMEVLAVAYFELMTEATAA